MENHNQENMGSPKIKRLPIWLQITICSIILMFAISIGITKIGGAEYDKLFCIRELNKKSIYLKDNERAGILRDYKTPYTKMVSPQLNAYNISLDGVASEEAYSIGCCRIPLDAKGVSKSQNCIYTPNYEKPTISQCFSHFLKRFK